MTASAHDVKHYVHMLRRQLAAEHTVLGLAGQQIPIAAHTQVLHPELVRQLRAWLKRKSRLAPTTPLFRISGRIAGGIDRKTHKMIQRDLAAARQKWIEEAETDSERAKREASDFLAHKNHAGLFADFHSCRHLFITNLERAGIRPKMAQTLARHSDIRLTLGVYTHVDLPDQTAAIAALPGPPGA